MIRHEDGMVTAENAAEVMQCLLAGYVSEEESDTWPIKLTEDKSLAEKIDNKVWSICYYVPQAPCTFCRQAVKEPEWFGNKTAIDHIFDGKSVHAKDESGVYPGRIDGTTPIIALHNALFCLSTDYDRWQSELAAQQKPYDPTEEEVEEMAKCLSKEFQIGFDGDFDHPWDGLDANIISGYLAEARHVLRLLHEAKQCALPVPQAPQKTEGLTLWECAPHLWPDGTEFECTLVPVNRAYFDILAGNAIWRTNPSTGEVECSDWRVAKKGGNNE